MYPKNNASPERIAVVQVVLVADGTVQSAVSIVVRGQGGAEGAGTGTIAYGADGTVYYTPDQAETNYTSFVVIAYKASCFSASQTIITTASSTPGQVDVKSVAGTAQTANDNGADINSILTDTNELQTDWVNGGRLDLILDIIAADTTTDIPALIAALQAVADATLVDTGTSLPATLTTIAGYLDTEIAAILAVTNALPDAGALTTLITHLTDIKGGTFSGATDSLEAIRDRGDVAWTTGAGGSSPTVEQIRAEIDTNLTQLAAIVIDTTALQAENIPDQLKNTALLFQYFEADGLQKKLGTDFDQEVMEGIVNNFVDKDKKETKIIKWFNN